MQWVETTAKTVDEAKGLALDQLGVAEDDAQFEIITEPRAGLFGRVKGEARVRARVQPTAVRPKIERRDRRKGREQGERPSTAPQGDTVAAVKRESAPRTRAPRSPQPSVQQPRRESAAKPQREESTVSAQQVGEEAKKFLIELVGAFGLEGTVDLREDGDDLELTVSGSDLGLMVGPRGNTLVAVQDLTRVASQRRLGDHDTRLRVDVGGYRERRREALGRFANQIAEQVVSSGEARALEPMSSADRKVIHDVLTDNAAVVTRSEGDDPNRRVVIAPANA